MKSCPGQQSMGAEALRETPPCRPSAMAGLLEAQDSFFLPHTPNPHTQGQLSLSPFFSLLPLSRPHVSLKHHRFNPEIQAPAAESTDHGRLKRASVPEGVHMGLKIES